MGKSIRMELRQHPFKFRGRKPNVLSLSRPPPLRGHVDVGPPVVGAGGVENLAPDTSDPPEWRWWRCFVKCFRPPVKREALDTLKF